MACPDICTAEKCRELEGRLSALEQSFELLKASFDSHINQNIPEAHNYSPDLKVETTLSSGVLTTSVDIDSIKRSDSVDLSNIPVNSVQVNLKNNPDEYNQLLTVSVNGTKGERLIRIPKPSLGLKIKPVNESKFDFEVSLGDRKAKETLFIKALEDLLNGKGGDDFTVKLRYNLGLLELELTIGGVTKKASVEITKPNVQLGSFGGGGGQVACADLEAAFEDRIELVLNAIAELRTKVVNVEKYVTIDIEGETYEELECPEGETGGEEETEGEEAPKEYGTLIEYKGKGLLGIHQLAQIINNNLVRLFEASCDKDGVVAFPAWWQVRLMANVPQVVCIFRKSGTSTYHSIAIPHPANTEKPGGVILPPYTKGNYMGMVTCKDNSKFIINCESEAEAERMCNAAIAKIDPEFLETPPRVYIGKRKGQAVSVNSMSPTSIEYYSEGQQNNIPDWRVRLNKIAPE